MIKLFENFNKIPDTFKVNAVKFDNYYRHFGIHPKFASLYGDDPNDIEEITMVVDKNITTQNRDKSLDKEQGYWGWFDQKQQRFTLIYPCFLQLYVCFPGGILGEERSGQGQAFKLDVLK
jgi:hypothetical protein